MFIISLIHSDLPNGFVSYYRHTEKDALERAEELRTSKYDGIIVEDDKGNLIMEC